MALELNGTTGVSLVQDGVVTAADLASGAITSAALPAGSVLQVVRASGGGQESTTSSTYSATNITATITPTSASSKLLVMPFVDGVYSAGGANVIVNFRLYRDGSNIGNFGAAGQSSSIGTLVLGACAGSFYVDSSSTSPTTFTVYFSSQFDTATVLHSTYSAVSSIVIMEIAG